MDSLRYWVLEMHVDGFRFDLASALARELHDVDRLSAFFDVINQDPVLSQVKLIAEPWDLGEGGYQVGNFPRAGPSGTGSTATRSAATGRATRGRSAELGYRLTGSSDLYEPERPPARTRASTSSPRTTASPSPTSSATTPSTTRPTARTTSDGADDNAVVELRRRGADRTIPRSSTLRQRQMRNFLATLLAVAGYPDALRRATRSRARSPATTTPTARTTRSRGSRGRSRPAARRRLEFTRSLIRLRLRNPVFHRRTFFQGRRIHGSAAKDLSWFRPDGKEMTEEEWANGFNRCLGLRLVGDAIEEVDDMGERIVGDTFLVLLNAHHEAIPFILPAHEARVRWEPVLDTHAGDAPDSAPHPRAGDPYDLLGRSLAVLRLRLATTTASAQGTRLRAVRPPPPPCPERGATS